MALKIRRSNGRGAVVSSLNMTVEALNLAKEASSITPAKAVFGAVSVLLAMIRDALANEWDYVELGLSCADVCEVLGRGLKGRRLDELSQSVLTAVEQLTITVAEIQRKIIKRRERNAVSRLLHAKYDRDNISTWRQDLIRVLHVFNTELAINTHSMVVDVHRKVFVDQGGDCGQHHPASARPAMMNTLESTLSHFSNGPLGELPPPAPRVCFGRGKLIDEIVSLAENLEPFALIGPGGVGKTSLALTVLHHDRIKYRFGSNRWFIRCDQFPASHTLFLARLSQVIGAGVQNPGDLTPLRQFLSSRNGILLLDNAESVLDPHGPDAREIYSVVEELSHFGNISLGITSRISTIPPHFKRPAIPKLSMESACDIFYAIYTNDVRSDIVSDLVRQLDFHALSITLLATTACHNMWDYNRLANEWNTHRAQVLQTGHSGGLGATVELSLASPTFRKLDPDARELLGVAAFFPQGINENNLEWLFPTISNSKTIFDKFCVLSLTSRSNGFVTMLAPIRDYLIPKDPRSSPLLCAARDYYLARLSVYVHPDKPGFAGAGWIVSEDVNVEHLLNAFTPIDMASENIWNACAHFMSHLYWHKKRYTILRSKIEGLPDDHPSKAQCFFQLARLSRSVGNHADEKSLLTHTLMLERVRGNDNQVACTLKHLANANRLLGLHEEGIRQSKEAFQVYEGLRDTVGQAECLNRLAWLLLDSNQLDAAEDAASRTIDLLLGQGREFRLSDSHLVLGNIYYLKGEKEKAARHYKFALRIASTSNWDNQLFWIHHFLAVLSQDEKKFDEAHAHIDQAMSHAADNAYCLGCAMKVRALVWYRQRRFEDAVAEVMRALEIFETLGAAKELGNCKPLLQKIEKAAGLHGRIQF